jgi:acyl carrier protein
MVWSQRRRAVQDPIKTAIRQYILDNYLQGEAPENLADDAPLRTSGILDSLGTLSLVTFLEQEFGIEIEAHETGVENFDSLADIAAFVSRKQAVAS